MKLTGTNLQSITPTKVSSDSKSVSAAAPVRATSRDASAVSQLSSREMVEQGPPIDQNRIDQLRSAIAEGSYVIDTDKLAQKMIELDLLPKS